MQKRIYLALGASLVLVGLAVFMRFSGESTPSSGLTVVDKSYETVDYTGEFFDSATSTDTFDYSQPENLSSTDLIGRQLIGDYISLSASGQVTPDALTTLAERYIDSIPTLAVSERAEFRDLKITANNKDSFGKYESEMTQMYQNYAQKLFYLQSSGSVATFIRVGSGDAPVKMAAIYDEMAKKLLGVAVPTAVSKHHLELTNLYLENSSAMKYLSALEEDPASAFSGLLKMNENINRETEILIKIEQTLTANGI